MAEDGAQLFDELMRFRPEGMTANAWAVQAGVSRTIWADLKRHGNPSRRTLSKLLEAAGSSLAEFEALRIGTPSQLAPEVGRLAESSLRWRQAPLAPLPVLWTGPGGLWGDPGRGIELMSIELGKVIDRLPRPSSLAADRDAHAVAIVGESMWPRFRPGRRIIVAPAAPVSIGDDVLVLLRSQFDRRGEHALVKELVGRSVSGLKLRQFNPDIIFDVAAPEIATIQKVLGEAF